MLKKESSVQQNSSDHMTLKKPSSVDEDTNFEQYSDLGKIKLGNKNTKSKEFHHGTFIRSESPKYEPKELKQQIEQLSQNPQSVFTSPKQSN